MKASRLFLGREHETQVARLAAHYGKPPGFEIGLHFDLGMAKRVAERKPCFRWQHLNLPGVDQPNALQTDLSQLATFEEAYHQLMHELVDRQLESLQLARGKTPVKKIFIDGGFAANDLYLALLARALPGAELMVADASMGSALGAAICVAWPTTDKSAISDRLPPGFLEKNYKLRKYSG